ncbi:hypothetical protein [Ferruginibacter sp. HRS2-29]|uniref:hypothetical protein n=1 Tax=Ferruginibacter sp. HRS2-29 TaxID=2487334 RepID=UPI0020CBF7ED|nr:hypothetical protein [Ferruginibacter sp. HRS2-29]MCP9752577.1 hypothetical protein [Ferruginibacter sp. HRS2-29]
MKQSYILRVAAKSFIVGAVICLCFYTVIRVMFWDFQFSFSEELSNLFIIVSRGGLMFTAAAVVYVLAEKAALSWLAVNRTAAKSSTLHNSDPLPGILVAARQ